MEIAGGPSPRIGEQRPLPAHPTAVSAHLSCPELDMAVVAWAAGADAFCSLAAGRSGDRLQPQLQLTQRQPPNDRLPSAISFAP